MRRWHALPVAALVAIATAAGLFSAVAPRAEAGGPLTTLNVDCDTGTAGIQTTCVLPSGTSSLTVDIVLVNNDTAFDVGAFNFAVITSQLVLNPPAGADVNMNANPNFSESGVGAVGSWSCTPPAPNNDQDADPSIANSFLSCFESTGSGPSATATPLVLARVTYNVVADGQTDISIGTANVGDVLGTPFVDCLGVTVGDACVDANVTIGTAVDTPTPTASPTATNTPCVSNCPPTATSTSLAFVTITPTPGGETATPAPGEPTTAPGGETPAAPGGGGGQQPGGGTGAGGGRPITLPDTGSNGSGGIDWSSFGLVALIALAAGTLAGGTYYYAARRVTGGREE